MKWILTLGVVAGVIYCWCKKKSCGEENDFDTFSSDDYFPESETFNSKDDEQFSVPSEISPTPWTENSNIEGSEDKCKETTEGLQNMLCDDYGWALDVLLYLAATSGSVDKKARDMIASFVKSIPKFSSLEDSLVDKTLEDLRRPGKMEARNRVKAAIKQGTDFSILQDTIDKLETIQKEDNKEFWTFRKYIEKQRRPATAVGS